MLIKVCVSYSYKHLLDEIKNW